MKRYRNIKLEKKLDDKSIPRYPQPTHQHNFGYRSTQEVSPHEYSNQTTLTIQHPQCHNILLVPMRKPGVLVQISFMNKEPGENFNK